MRILPTLWLLVPCQILWRFFISPNPTLGPRHYICVPRWTPGFIPKDILAPLPTSFTYRTGVGTLMGNWPDQILIPPACKHANPEILSHSPPLFSRLTNLPSYSDSDNCYDAEDHAMEETIQANNGCLPHSAIFTTRSVTPAC
ncbi:hypothetical protein DSO57_1000926 [Entomophthora muscae]|uniref:Uncharacterized protein n=1 Tax=Entomophthora muscae TaxID=34485 RepID=A0ACC2TKH7_9FUNG|nr:hypothetical protein DSO57_1000926 [Entomophthora muscae]